MKNKAYVLLKSISDTQTQVCKVSEDKTALKRLKRKLIKEQSSIIDFRNMIQAKRKEFAIEWNRNNEISFKLEEVVNREDRMWKWVSTQLEHYIKELFIPDSIMEKCYPSFSFIPYDYAIQEAEMI